MLILSTSWQGHGNETESLMSVSGQLNIMFGVDLRRGSLVLSGQPSIICKNSIIV